MSQQLLPCLTSNINENSVCCFSFKRFPLEVRSLAQNGLDAIVGGEGGVSSHSYITLPLTKLLEFNSHKPLAVHAADSKFGDYTLPANRYLNGKRRPDLTLCDA